MSGDDKHSNSEKTSTSPFSVQLLAYCDELAETFPEYVAQINSVRNADHNTLMKFFSEALAKLRSDGQVAAAAGHGLSVMPTAFLPGIPVDSTLWQSLSSQTQSAICEYIRILGMCAFFEGGESFEAAQEQWQKFMEEYVNNVEFTKLTETLQHFMNKFTKKTNGTSEADTGGTAEATVEGEGEGEGEDKGAGTASSFFGNGFPKLPERFLHGHLAKLAEELVRDIRPEDLGLTPQMLQQLEESPSRALELMMEVFSRNPQVLQNTFQRIGRQLQQKVASGQIKANEIAREAEELMKEFAENTDFVAMMEGLKSAFGMEDMEIARKAGKEGSARMAAVKARLQKKKEAKDAALAAAAAAAASPGSAYPGQNVVSVPSIDDLVHQIESTGNRNNSKNSKKVNSGKTKK